MAEGEQTDAQLTQQIRAFWTQMTPMRRMMLIGLTVGCLALIGILIAQGRTANHQVLFRDMADSDAAAVLEYLRAQGISYDLSADGRTVRVPADRVAELRIDMAGQGLTPQGGTGGFDVFNSTPIGMTDGVYNIRRLQAIQGELAQTIRQLDVVDSVRVHVVLPDETDFFSEGPEPTASVVIRMARGARLAQRQVEGITAMVAAAVPDLQTESVVLIDAATGRSLSPMGEEPLAERTGFHERVRLEYEQGRERAIVTALEQVVGPGNVVARVAAEFDFTETTTEQRTLDRPTNLSTTEEVDIVPNGENTIGGSVGSDSELGEEVIEEIVGSGSSYHRSVTTDSDAGSTTTRSLVPGGIMNCQSASVILHQKTVVEEPPEDAEEDAEPQITYVAWTAEELTEFEEIVKRAIGFQEGRDSVTVTSMAFVSPGGETFDDSVYESMMWRQWVMSLVRLGLIIAAGGLLYWMILRPVAKQVLSPVFLSAGDVPAGLLGSRVGDAQRQLARGVPPSQQADVQRALAGGREQLQQSNEHLQGEGASGPEEEYNGPPLSEQDPETAQLSMQVNQLVKTSPVQAADVIRGWLRDGT
jgi:flagellar M-ring protein FliF